MSHPPSSPPIPQSPSPVLPTVAMSRLPTPPHPLPPPFKYRWDTTGLTITSATNRTNAFTNWAVLAKICSEMLEMPCNFAGMFHSGSHNIFRRLVTTEIRPQQMFIIRIPLIPDSCVDPRESKTWWTNVEDNCLLSEIATMRWVQENSQIPVPKVIAFDNEVGAAGVPWVLMEAVKGHPYTEVKPHTLASNGEPTEQQQEKVRQAVAWVQVQLSRATLPGIGVLQLHTNKTVFLDKLPDFPNGPFTSTGDFLFSWSHLVSCSALLFRLGKQLSTLDEEYREFPKRLLQLLPHLTKPQSDPERFPLIRHDFRSKNMLFDDEYNLVGVVDWRDCFSAPFNFFAGRTCMYAVWSRAEARLVVESTYKQEVARMEAQMSIDNKLSAALESPTSDLGMCLWAYEKGVVGIEYQRVIDKLVVRGVRFPGGENSGFLPDPNIWI